MSFQGYINKLIDTNNITSAGIISIFNGKILGFSNGWIFKEGETESIISLFKSKDKKDEFLISGIKYKIIKETKFNNGKVSIHAKNQNGDHVQIDKTFFSILIGHFDKTKYNDAIFDVEKLSNKIIDHEF